MKKINEYSNEILASYYKNYEVYVVTCIIKGMKKDTENGVLRNQIWTGNKYSNPFQQRFWLDIYNDNKRNALLKETNEAKRQKLEYEIMFNKIFDEILVWFCKGYESDDELGSIPCDKIESLNWTKEYTQKFVDEGGDPEYSWEKLTENDEIYLECGRAPRLAMLDFIWETLQYCDDKEIEKLLKFADEGYKSKWVKADYNPKRNQSKKKQVKDLETGIIYESQNDCAKAIGKVKSYISKHKERFVSI